MGDDVLLLDSDLVNNKIGQASITIAVGARARYLVGLLRVGTFEFFCFFLLFFLFFFFFWVECFFFLFLFRFYLLFLCFLLLLDRLATRIESAVLAPVSFHSRLIDRGQVAVTEASGRPWDRRVENRARVAAHGIVRVDVRVIAAEAVFIACPTRRAGVIRAMAARFTFVQAYGDTGGGEQVEDRAHALLKAVIGDEELQLFLKLCVGETADRVEFFLWVAFAFQLMRVFTVADPRRIWVGVGVGAHEGGPVQSVLFGGVGVLGVDREHVGARAAGGAHLLEKRIDHVLPIVVVVVGGIPVDRICFVRRQHWAACGVGKGERTGDGEEILEPIPLERAIENEVRFARLQADSRRRAGAGWNRLDDGSRRRGSEQQPNQQGHRGAEEKSAAADGGRAEADQLGERASRGGHEGIIGSMRPMP